MGSYRCRVGQKHDGIVVPTCSIPHFEIDPVMLDEQPQRRERAELERLQDVPPCHTRVQSGHRIHGLAPEDGGS